MEQLGQRQGLWAMPGYFFDVRDGDHVTLGDEPLEFQDLEAAHRDAAAALAEMARDVLPLSKQREMVINVRSETGERVLSLSLTFAAERARES
jgi:hypothetical protein